MLIYSFLCLLSNNFLVAPQVTFVAQIWLSCTLSLRFCTLSVAPKLTLKALGADHLRIYRVLIFSLCSSGVFIPSDLLSLSRSLVFISCLYLLLSIVFISECSSLVYSSNNFLGAVGIILSLCLQHACRSLTTALVSYSNHHFFWDIVPIMPITWPCKLAYHQVLIIAHILFVLHYANVSVRGQL